MDMLLILFYTYHYPSLYIDIQHRSHQRRPARLLSRHLDSQCDLLRYSGLLSLLLCCRSDLWRFRFIRCRNYRIRWFMYVTSSKSCLLPSPMGLATDFNDDYLYSRNVLILRNDLIFLQWLLLCSSKSLWISNILAVWLLFHADCCNLHRLAGLLWQATRATHARDAIQRVRTQWWVQ